MLQIKTIRNTDPEIFDKRVNAALSEGWQLSKRETLAPYGQHAAIVFCAALVRAIDEEAAK